ncbi:MAG: phage holin family protein [Jiangellales bacterium]
MDALEPGDLRRALASLLAAAGGLAVADWLLPGLTVQSWPWLLAGALALGVVGALVRPVLLWLATRLGWVGALLLALLGNALVVALVVVLLPGIVATSFWPVFWASWIIAAAVTLIAWLSTAGTSQVVTTRLIRQARRRPATVDDPDLPGVLFVQLDGVPYPVLEWGVLAGTLPTLARWVRSGSYRMLEWTPSMPATTPASQMGILHGTIDGIPAFRWLDRETGRVFVANKPHDAADIEAVHSNGRGLLADGGVSVSNLFTGDAPMALATMSALGRGGTSHESRRMINDFLVRPEGLARGLTRTVSEVVRERTQARRQIRQGIEPRVHRGWSFAAERAALNGVLRDFNTIAVSTSMLEGARSIYVDFVDYDAVAHHAGIWRPESLDALVGLDAVLAQLEQVAAVAPRRYSIVVLSDHGQSQGEVFADRYGDDLSALVQRLSGSTVTGTDVNTEGSAMLAAAVGGDDAGSPVSQAVRVGTGALDRQADADVAQAEEAATTDDGFLVFGSGNLGLVYVTGHRQRLTRDHLDRLYPRLVSGLVEHEGVSFVVAGTDDGPVVIGASGEHHLVDGHIVGDDPLASFSADAPAFILRAATMPEAPDLYVNSLVDPSTGEVAAFEGLVGCHGGLGGWQDRAMMVYPADFPAPTDRIVGADAVHRQLVTWLEVLGHRTGM